MMRHAEKDVALDESQGGQARITAFVGRGQPRRHGSDAVQDPWTPGGVLLGVFVGGSLVIFPNGFPW